MRQIAILTVIPLTLAISLSAMAQWEVVLEPDFATTFTDVYAIDSQKVWVVGGEGTVVYTNNGGQKWTRRDIGASGLLRQVQFDDAQHGWILEGEVSLHHTKDRGSHWEKVTVPSLRGFYFVNHELGYAIGAGNSILRTVDGGRNWEAKFGADFELVAIQFINEKEGWVTGTYSILHTQDGGEAWEKYGGIRSHYSNIHRTDLCFIDNQEGWITGLDGRLGYTIDGGKTLDVLSSPVSGFNARVHFVDSKEGWGVEDHSGCIWHTVDGGKTWITDMIDSGSRLFTIHFAQNSRSGWAVGEDGTILHCNGDGTWTSQTVRQVSLHSIHFVSDEKGWAVGEKHAILHTSDGGTNWSPQKSPFPLPKWPTGCDFYDVYFVDDETGWIAGDREIHHTNDGGNTWIGALTNHKLYSIYFVNSQEGWAAGENGCVLHTEDGGNSWTPQQTNVGVTLYDVYFVDDLRGWMVGEHGVILHTENGGKRWTLQVSGTDQRLRSVYFVSSNRGYVVGAGIILYTRNGGRKWTSVNDRGAWSISFANSQEGWAVAGEIMPYIAHTANGGQSWEYTEIPYTAPLRPISYSKLWGVHARGNYAWVVGPGCVLKYTKPIPIDVAGLLINGKPLQIDMKAEDFPTAVNTRNGVVIEAVLVDKSMRVNLMISPISVIAPNGQLVDGALEWNGVDTIQFQTHPLPQQGIYSVIVLGPTLIPSFTTNFLFELDKPVAQLTDSGTETNYENEVVRLRGTAQDPPGQGKIPASGVALVEMGATGPDRHTHWYLAVDDSDPEQDFWSRWHLDFLPSKSGEYQLDIRVADRAGNSAIFKGVRLHFSVSFDFRGEVYAWPNPVGREYGDKVHISYDVNIAQEERANIHLCIYTVAGDLVYKKTHMNRGPGRGDRSISWDLANPTSGNMVAGGIYIFRLRADNGENTADRVGVILVVK